MLVNLQNSDGKDGKSTPLSLKEDLAERDLGAGKPLEIVVKSKE